MLLGVLIAAIPLSIVGSILTPNRPPHWGRVKCAANLKGLSVHLAIYAVDHGGVYPTPQKWCDLLIDKAREDFGDPNGPEFLNGILRCPRGAEGRCHYAMNPYADPCSPSDTVLLFESKSGWNQSGGAELLAPENHEGEGCNVLFIDSSVMFVKAEDVNSLKWVPADKAQGETSPGSTSVERRKTGGELEYWLENMITYHRFTSEEVRAATGLTEEEVSAAQESHGISSRSRVVRGERGPLLVLPYPGGRHPRIGFLEGAIDPQRETKFSVFTPWDPNSYVVVDVPEAIWSNLGLTYLAHTHIDTIWTKQGIELPKLEWNRRPGGSLDIERTLPNGIAFGVKAVPDKEAVRMEMWLRNGTDERLTDLRVQICVMTKMAAGFAGQTNENKVFTNPYVACRSASGNRWLITAWEGCDRPWGNERCPCFHSDPKFPDLEPGQQTRLRGWLSFYEGPDIRAEFARIEATGWRQN